MTCDEILNITTVKNPWDLTVGERSAVLSHIMGCPSCRVEFGPGNRTRAMEPDELEMVKQTFIKDTKDSEALAYRPDLTEGDIGQAVERLEQDARRMLGL